MTWSLKLATSDDSAALLPLVADYHAFEGIGLSADKRSAALALLLSEPSLGGIWLIRHADDVAGYIALCRGFSLEFGGFDAFIDELYLRPEWRGRGGGKAAISLIQDVARQRGIQALHLEVARDNDTAKGLYRAVGFEAREQFMLMSLRL